MNRFTLHVAAPRLEAGGRWETQGAAEAADDDSDNAGLVDDAGDGRHGWTSLDDDPQGPDATQLAKLTAVPKYGVNHS